MSIVETKLLVQTEKGRTYKKPVKMDFVDGRIEFLKSPFELKDEIKAMAGAKWHGFDSEPRKVWSVKDCQRNRFQLAYLQGENPYEWFDRDLIRHEYTRPLRQHQHDLADGCLTYHFQILGAEMGLGKSLVAIEVMERSVPTWWYVAPKKPLEAVKREFKKWDLAPHVKVQLFTYEGFTRAVDELTPDQEIPQGVIFDEASKLKNADATRSKAAQYMADAIRAKYGHDGYVILMTGTPSPKTPVDWWSLCEIAYPGFLREGSEKSFRARLAYLEQKQFETGGIHNELIGWRDSAQKCNTCGRFEGEHDIDDGHGFTPGVNEVALMYERLQGLVIIKLKKDCLDLPEIQYRKIYCKPSPATLRVAQALANSTLNAAAGATLLRELSDGFQYREERDGSTACTHCDDGTVGEWFDPADESRTFGAVDMLDPELVDRLVCRQVECPQCNGTRVVPKMVRSVREVPCPKDDVLRDLLAEYEETGRFVCFAGFTASVDRCVRICLEENWDVVRCDGRGFVVYRKESDGQTSVVKTDALDYWADRNNIRVVFVGHPESGGMGLTLVESCVAYFYSNTFKPEYREQAIARIHRIGVDENRGATIIDAIHLPTDERVIQILKDNRRLELMTMGELTAGAFDEQSR